MGPHLFLGAFQSVLPVRRFVGAAPLPAQCSFRYLQPGGLNDRGGTGPQKGEERRLQVISQHVRRR